jgi:uncharacterized Zn-finger protein
MAHFLLLLGAGFAAWPGKSKDNRTLPLPFSCPGALAMVAPIPTIIQVPTMAHGSTPHFHNTQGLGSIEIGSKEFQCIGALPPFDHPHIFLDMGKGDEIVCPYCSTLYVYKAALGAGHSNPASAIFQADAA